MLKVLVGYVKRTFNEFSEDGGPSIAAAIAYYTAFSLPPLLLLVVWVAGFVVDPADVQRALALQMESLHGREGADLLGDIVSSASLRPSGRGIGAVTGIVALILGATGAFIELQYGLNRIWGVEPGPSDGGFREFLLKRVVSLGILLVIAFLLIISLAASAVISAFGSWIEELVPWLNGVVLVILDLTLSLTVFTLLIGLIFKFLPDAVLSFRDVRTGALITAVLLVLGKFTIGFYLGQSDLGSVYGAAGSLAIILTWIYYSAMILLIGAEFTQVWVRGQGRRIVPERGRVVSS